VSLDYREEANSGLLNMNEATQNMQGKVVLITGADGGIGSETTQACGSLVRS